MEPNRTRMLVYCAAMLAALASLACGEASYELWLTYPDQAARDRARNVDLFVGEGIVCNVLTDLDAEPRLSFDAQGEVPELGAVRIGLVSFLAEVRDEGCQVFVDGCVEQRLEPGENAIVRIELQPTDGPACGPGLSCRGGRCITADGGVVDAGVIDANAADTAAADAAASDSAATDATLADVPLADAAAADAAAADAIVSFDADTIDAAAADTAAPDSAAADVAALDTAVADIAAPDVAGADTATPDAAGADTAAFDAAQPDSWQPDAAVCAPNGATCVAGELVTCDADGQPVSTDPCLLGCNSAAVPQRCYIPVPSNLTSDDLQGWTEDLALDSSGLLDTDAVQLDGVDLDPSTYETVSQGGGAPEILVLGGRNITLAAGVEVRVIGSRALAMVAAETVTLAGVVDLSASGTAVHWDDPAWPWFYNELGGPGGSNGGAEGMPGEGDCPGTPGEGVDIANIYAKGSGGGGYGAAGGEGGDALNGDPNDPQPLGGGLGGGQCGNAELIPLVGGSGGAGSVDVTGEGPDGDWAGLGGGGGGALQISAGESVTISANGGLTAGGGGGGQTGNGGGAGGGAGGAILIEAPSIFIEQDAYITANGGAGSAGDCT